MPGIQLKHIAPTAVLIVAASPMLLFADQKSPQDYLKYKPLMLEVRYCECPAIDMSSGPSEVLPSFMDESSLLQVGVLSEEAGFLASDEVSMGYELKPVEDKPGKFHFNYSGSYTPGDRESSGKAKLVLDKGQWVSLFGANWQSQRDTGATGVAVRLVEADGS